MVWRSDDGTIEHCALTLRDSGCSLVGTVLGVADGLPVRIEYRVLTDAAGLTTAAHVRQLRGYEQRTLALARDSKGGWSVDGAPVRALRGCTDADLECTPSTNTLPIHRIRFAVGSEQAIRVAWVRFPQLTVEQASQTYRRLDEATYHFASAAWEGELAVDDVGLVTRYDGWQRTGIAIGPEESEPLDASR